MRASLHATLLATVVLLAQPVWGHHSTSAIFENDKRITVTGTLTKVDWINPHIVIFLESRAARPPRPGGFRGIRRRGGGLWAWAAPTSQRGWVRA